MAFALVVLVFGLAWSGCTLRGRSSQRETLEVSPAEKTLCLGQGYQFLAVRGGEKVREAEWRVSGGVIGSEGFYLAPETPGEYEVSAQVNGGRTQAAAAVHVVQCNDGEPLPSPTPSPLVLSTATAARPTRTPTAVGRTSAIPPTPTPTQLPSPTPPTLTPTPTGTPPGAPPPKPTPTATATRLPLPTPTATLAPAVCLDRSGDLARYDTLTPVTATVPGADLARASFDAETSLILWMTLYQPVPDAPDVERFWLFALDTDGDRATGRPLGDGAINPDIGVEVTIGVTWSPELGPEPEPYIFIWNADTGTSDRRTEGVEASFSRARDAVFLRIELDLLARLVSEFSGTVPDWDRMIVRAGTLAMTDEGMVVDFCPDLP